MVQKEKVVINILFFMILNICCSGAESMQPFVVEKIQDAVTDGRAITPMDLVRHILHKDRDFCKPQGRATKGNAQRLLMQQITRVRAWVGRVMDAENFSVRKPTHVAQNAYVNVEEVEDFVLMVISYMRR